MLFREQRRSDGIENVRKYSAQFFSMLMCVCLVKEHIGIRDYVLWLICKCPQISEAGTAFEADAKIFNIEIERREPCQLVQLSFYEINGVRFGDDLFRDLYFHCFQHKHVAR